MRMHAEETTGNIVGWGNTKGLKSGFVEYDMTGLVYTREETNISEIPGIDEAEKSIGESLPE